jgi:hypothetical protein
LLNGRNCPKKQTEAILADLMTLTARHLKKGARLRLTGLGISGIRSCSSATSGLAGTVMITKVRNISPSGLRQPSHKPPSAMIWPSDRAIAKGCLPLEVFSPFVECAGRDQTATPRECGLEKTAAHGELHSEDR